MKSNGVFIQKMEVVNRHTSKGMKISYIHLYSRGLYKVITKVIQHKLLLFVSKAGTETDYGRRNNGEWHSRSHQMLTHRPFGHALFNLFRIITVAASDARLIVVLTLRGDL